MIQKLQDQISFLLLIFAGFVFNACNLSDTREIFNVDQFEQNIRAALDGQTVGYAYAINQDGELVKSGASGYARTQIDGQMDQSASKRMNIASISKTISAVAVLKLLEKRGLSINDLIAPWLPQDWSLGPGVSTLSFKNLLTHRTGFVSNNSYLEQTISFIAIKKTIAIGVSQSQTYKYQNVNFALCRVIIPALWKGLAGAPEIGEIDATSASLFYRNFVETEIMDKIGVMNVDCINPPGELPTLGYYSKRAGEHGLDYGQWNWYELCAAGGYYLSAIELANFMVHIRYDDMLLSPANRAIMDKNHFGWCESGIMIGSKGSYYNHGGSIEWDTGTIKGNMRGLVVKYPNNIEAVLLINSDIANGNYITTIMTQAYDDAWE